MIVIPILVGVLLLWLAMSTMGYFALGDVGWWEIAGVTAATICGGALAVGLVFACALWVEAWS